MPRFLTEKDAHFEEPVALTVGAFDGLHRGHRYLLTRLYEEARNRWLEPVMLTFVPHPAWVLHSANAPRLLTLDDEKKFLLKESPMEAVIFHTFNKEFARKTGAEFLAYLKEKFNVSLLVLGHDHAFGSDFLRDDDMIRKIASETGISVVRVKPFMFKGRIVSSSLIRNLISEKNIEEANTFLGYDYLLTGKVVHGSRFGRKIGFPTANLSVDTKKLVPPAGVYAVYSFIEGRMYKGVMNIGKRPTVSGREEQVEVHFLNFSGDLYGKNLRVHVREFLRDEKKFAGVEDLKKQIEKDIARISL